MGVIYEANSVLLVHLFFLLTISRSASDKYLKIFLFVSIKPLAKSV